MKSSMTKWDRRRKRLLDIIEVGSYFDAPSRYYDYINAASIILNLTVTIMMTFEQMSVAYGAVLEVIQQITLLFFAVDYLLRIWTAKFLYKDLSEWKAIFKYIFSFSGLIDLLSFLPEYLPFFFPGGTIAFRMIRIVRIFRLFRINYYFDSLSVITEVLKSRKQQLISSVFIIVVLMIASSLCMYSLEHEAQPEVFNNAFSGIWWAASTLLTVGYGDIYPITTLGKVFGIFITFLGVGVVAIPTGIISAGFVEQYGVMKRKSIIAHQADMHFIKVPMCADDDWIGKRVADLGLPRRIIVAMIKREGKVVVPRGDVIIQLDDVLILGAEPYQDQEDIHLTEIILHEEHPWANHKIRELDISRHTFIVLIKRKNKTHVPNGNMTLKDGDHVFLYTQKYVKDANDIEI